MFLAPEIVIKEGEPSTPADGQSMDAALSLALADLKAEFLDLQTPVR